MENNISIVPAKHDIALLQNKVGTQLKDLADSISRRQYELKELIDKTKSSNMKIVIERHWWGSIDKNSIETSLKNVYSNLGGYITDCGEAIQSTNANLAKTLELIKLLTIVEKNLYEQIDDQNVSSNELKSILSVWFKQQGIKDEDVKELLETSFERAYTLRDRINVLRNECNTKISQALERISILEEQLENASSEIDKLLDKAVCELRKEIVRNKEALETTYEDKRQSLLILTEEKENEIRKISEDFKVTAETEQENTSRIHKSIESQYDRILGLTENFSKLHSENESRLISLSNEKCEELHGIQRNAEESFCQLAKEKESILDSKKQNLEKCLDEFKHEFKEEKKSLRKMWFWMILGCISISSIISYVIVTLCK